jgi:hypothetical protein
MSLINEALKKAQWQRSQEPGAVTPPVPGAEPGVVRRGKRPANMLLLIGGGAALVVLSIVVTVLLVSREPAKPVVVARTTPAAAPKEIPTSTPGPVIIAPVLKPIEPAAGPATNLGPATANRIVPVASPDKPATTPAPNPSVANRPAVAETKAPATPVTAPPSVATTAPAPAPAPAAETPAVNAKGDERVHAFVDTIRVTGLRSSGNDSRVLMNEKVYRVNDIVERSLSIKLIKVDVDSLTFTDANGVQYVKYF